MSKQDIDEVFSFIQETVENKEIKLAFYGGEPLLHQDLLRYAIDKAHTLWKYRISISVSSNATLLTPVLIDWLFANKVRIDISIDGHKKVHNRQRRYCNGKGTFEKVYESLSYIREQHSAHLQDDVLILMTLAELDDLIEISINWHEDSLLKDIIPTKISSISPNFRLGVERSDYEVLVNKYLSLLEVYESHRELNVLKVFLEQCIAYWVNRPIIDVGNAVPMATCLPLNNKLYIDTHFNIGVCEKIADKYRIGNVKSGINWDVANSQVQEYYQKRVQRCRFCPAIRMCNMCFSAIEYSDDEWDILCHNEKTYTKVCFRLFCEMAERGLLQ